MSIQSDRWIREQALKHRMIEPFSEKQVREGVISYGLSSYGYDLRVSDEFKIFTNVNSAIIDPKAFDERSFVSVQAESVIVPPNSFALARSIEYFRIPARHSDDLRRQVDLRPLRNHRQCHALRAGMGGLCDPGDFQHHSACLRKSMPMRASARSCSFKVMNLAKSVTPIARGNTRNSRALFYPSSRRSNKRCAGLV